MNVGTITGNGRELADLTEKRKTDMLCIQKLKCKESKARLIGGGFKAMVLMEGEMTLEW